MKKLLAMLLALTMVFTFVACGAANNAVEPTAAPTAPATTEGTKETETPTDPVPEIKGEVNIYTVYGDNEIQILTDYVADIYPDLKLNFLRMNGGEMANRIIAEKDNPQCDFVVGAACEIYIQMAEAGALMSYQPKHTENYPDFYHDEDWNWYAVYLSYLGFYSDKDWFEAQGMDIPDSWEDLLDPRLEGQVIVTNPGTSTTGYMVLSSLVHLMGEEKALEYYAKLDKNVRNYASGGSGPSQSVALGEAPVGVGYMPLGLQLIEQGYTNLVVSVPSEGTGLEICSAAVINNAKNPENAKAIADILASPEWHQHSADTYAVGFMFASGVPCHGLEEFTDIKALKMDYVWAANNKDRLIAEWDKITSN